MPHRYWKIWDNIIRTIHASIRVSGFYAGPIVKKTKAMWLQHENRTKLIFKLESNTYRCFKLISHSRLEYVCDNTTFHDIVLFDLIGCHGVQVAEEDNTITTDGYDLQTQLPHQSIDPMAPTFMRIKQFNSWLHKFFTNGQQESSQSKWDVMVSSQAQEQLHRDDVTEFLTAVERLHPTLKRNLGGIQEILGLKELATAIEMEQAIGVADASIGSRHRAAHGYVLESRCGKYRIIGVAPIDCEADDLESTRAEIWGQIAVQTIINIICDMFSMTTGEVLVYGDNIDSLVETHLQPSKMAFPRFFKPNVDVKQLLQRLRTECSPKIAIYPEHIKGHQDRQRDFNYDEAPQSVHLNIDMDEISKDFLKTHKGPLEPTQIQQLLPGQQATLVIHKTPINNNIHHHVNLHFFGHNLEARFREKTGIS